jgi:hypothetical protein
MFKWELVFDAGKPYSVKVNSDKALFKELKKFYLAHKDEDSDFDVKVYNAKGEDFTESQFINEMIGEII